jgi:hypothetical protein
MRIYKVSRGERSEFAKPSTAHVVGYPLQDEVHIRFTGVGKKNVAMTYGEAVDLVGELVQRIAARARP